MNQRDIYNFSEEAKIKIGPLMVAYGDPKRNMTIRLGRKVTIEWNPDSNWVFLINTNFQTAVLDSDLNLRDWWLCPNCSKENFKEVLECYGTKCCLDYIASETFRSMAA
jgi:hypothetical protein